MSVFNFNTCIFSVSQRAGCLFCHAFGLYPDEPVNFFSANPELVCQICQKCQTTRGAEKSVKSINLLSLGRVFQFHVLCRLQALFRDNGSEFGTSQACRFCNVRARAQAISGAQKCLQRAFKRP